MPLQKFLLDMAFSFKMSFQTRKYRTQCHFGNIAFSLIIWNPAELVCSLRPAMSALSPAKSGIEGFDVEVEM